MAGVQGDSITFAVLLMLISSTESNKSSSSHTSYKLNHKEPEELSHTDLDDVIFLYKVSKGAKIRNRYNQVPHLTQDNNGKVTNSQLDTTNKSQEVSPFQAGDHKSHINRCAQRHSKHKTEKKPHKRSTKEVPPRNGL